jgi:RNA polymerase Rpb1, domain 5
VATTAKSGYIQRKIVKVCEDIQVQYDGTVRDATGKIYQFAYGDTGMDPTKTVKVDGIQQICDISRIVTRLNATIEEEPESDDEKKEVKVIQHSSAKTKLIKKIRTDFPKEIIDESLDIRRLRQRLQTLQLTNESSDDESDSDSDSD